MAGKHLVLIGGGGFAIELYGYMSAEGISVNGYYAKENNAELSNDILWLGDIEKKSQNDLDRNVEYILAIRNIADRKKMIRIMEQNGLAVGSYISKEAYYSCNAQLGKGCVVFPRAMITGNPVIGNYFFMDVLSVVSHGDRIGNNVVVGPAVTITGDCVIGDDVTFGVNASLLPGTEIGAGAEITINTFAPKKVCNNKIVFSLPGKIIG